MRGLAARHVLKMNVPSTRRVEAVFGTAAGAGVGGMLGF